MTEKQFENQVKAYLKGQGCWVLKTWSNGIQRDGVPDLLVCCNGYFLGVELKAANGKPSELQLWNIDKIRKAHGIAIVLYPNQFERFQNLIALLQQKAHYAAYIGQHDDFGRKEQHERKTINEAGDH